MALRKIVEQGDEMSDKGLPSGEGLQSTASTILLDDMAETLRQANGAGLAAPQVGVLRRVCIVIDENDEIIELINPVIVSTGGRADRSGGLPQRAWQVGHGHPAQPGAGSGPGPQWQSGLNVEGEGLTARAFCHEIEHLDGHLFAEHVDHFLSGAGTGGDYLETRRGGQDA